MLAVPAFEAARLLGIARAGRPRPSSNAIPYASTGVVFLVFGEGTQAALPEGTGFVVPRGKAPMTACTWISSKWPDAGVRLARGGPLLRRWRRATRTCWRRPTTSSIDACVAAPRRGARPPGRDPRRRRSSGGCARCRSTRSGTWSASRAIRRIAARRVSSSWAPPTTAWASPTASARRARRPSRSSRTSTARRSKRRPAR